MSIIMEFDGLLRDIKPTPRTSIAKQLHDITLMIKRRSLVVLVSDLFSDVDDILAGLDHLRFNGHDVVVFHTLDPHELEFPFKGAWCFEGLEEEEPLTTQADRIRDEYLTNFNEYMKSLREGCVASQIDYTAVNTALPLDDVLSEFIVKRQAMLNGGRG
jgi:hypothetical protein